MDIIFRAVGLVAVLSGIIILYKSKKAQIECLVRNPNSRKKFSRKMSIILHKKNIWLVLLGVTGLAFSVNSIELLCSFAIPTTFTATIVNLNLSFWKNILALVLYTFTYLLDDIIVFTLAMWTLSLKVFSPKLVQISHLIGGILLLCIGMMMALNPELLSRILT